MIDPDKWDFYAMDCARVVGDDDLAAAHASEVLRIGRMPDGSARWPMRMAEARLTLAVAGARAGELDEAVDNATTALDDDRQCVPSLLMVAAEFDQELRARYRRVAKARDWHESFVDMRRAITSGTIGVDQTG